MKKRNLLIYALFVIGSLTILATGCKKDDAILNNNGTTENTSYAPSNIYSKSLDYANGFTPYAFTSSGTCKVSDLSGVLTITNTPTYTYSKTSTTTATFTIKYKSKYGSGTYQVNYDYSETTKLTFTSETEGTYTSSWTQISTGFVKSTDSGKPSGSFSLN